MGRADSANGHACDGETKGHLEQHNREADGRRCIAIHSQMAAGHNNGWLMWVIISFRDVAARRDPHTNKLRARGNSGFWHRCNNSTIHAYDDGP